jgi:hypothetical protein
MAVLARASSNLAHLTDCSAQSSHRKFDPSSRRRRGPILKHVKVSRKTRIRSRVPMGPENKNDSAGEDQQQIAAVPHTPNG